MSELLTEFGEFILNINMRKTALMLFLVATSLGFIFQKIKKKDKDISEDLSQYEVDEEGRYPWEVDTDDSPERIDQQARRYHNQHGPKRGRW